MPTQITVPVNLLDDPIISMVAAAVGARCDFKNVEAQLNDVVTYSSRRRISCCYLNVPWSDGCQAAV